MPRNHYERICRATGAAATAPNPPFSTVTIRGELNRRLDVERPAGEKHQHRLSLPLVEQRKRIGVFHQL